MKAKWGKMDKRKIMLIALIGGGCAVLAIAAVIAIPRIKAAVEKPFAPLVLVHPFENPLFADAIASEAKEFGLLNKRFPAEAKAFGFPELQAYVDDPASAWDIAIGTSNFLKTPERFAAPPRPITGSMWGIYYNKAVLAKAGVLPPGAPPAQGKLALAASYGLGEFTEACERVKKSGALPIALGAKFAWPLAVWVQTIMAAAGNLDQAAALGDQGFELSSAHLAAGIEGFRSLIAKGYVSPRFQEGDWSDGLRAIATGKAAFCLINADALNTLLPKERAALGYMPPPSSISASDGKNLYAMGSLIYIGIKAGSSSEKRAVKLAEFLGSVGSAERLSKKTDSPFFAAGKGPARLIASVSSYPDSEAVKYIKSSFAR
jgi:ABC-type glycerol-3-phosphate transport system substrate-binding protein